MDAPLKTTILLTLLATGLPLDATAQQSKPQAAAPATAWPKLDAKQDERLRVLYANLLRNEEQLTKKSEAELVTLGAGVVEYLFKRFTDSEKNCNESLVRVLDQVTGPQHAALLAPLARDKCTAARLWVVGRIASFHDAAMASVLKNATKDKDKEIAYRGQLGLVAIGDKEAVGPVLARCADEWADVGELTLKLIAPGRSLELGNVALRKVDEGEAKFKIAGLCLLRALGIKSHAHGIAVYLDAEDSAVKKEAINALRVIVDGQPALDQLSVFDAIEMAKEWKKKV
jgi:hypothetical protein